MIRSLTASLTLAGVLITPIAAVAGTPVTATIIVSGLQQTTVTTQADDVGALLEEQGIHLGPSDQVTPALSARVPEDGVVRIDRVITWDKTESRKIASAVVERPDYALAPDATKVVSAGRSGIRVVTVRYTQRGDDVTKQVVSSRILQTMRPHVVAVGLGEYAAFQRFDRNALDRTSRMAGGAMQMVATAYTAGCAGCSGITAMGVAPGTASSPWIRASFRSERGSTFPDTDSRSPAIRAAPFAATASTSDSTRCATRCSSAVAAITVYRLK